MHYFDIVIKGLMVAVGLWLALELCFGIVKCLERDTARPVNSKRSEEERPYE